MDKMVVMRAAETADSTVAMMVDERDLKTVG